MLVIFDCDGVLVDSENLAAEVFSRCLQNCAITLNPQQCYTQFKGHTLDYCMAWLQQHYPQIPDDFLRTLGSETERAFTTQLQAVAGVEDVILNLRARNVPVCVASNGGHTKIEHSLHVTGLFDYFSEARFSRDDVPKGKPAPDLFLYAAEVMGVPAVFTTVIEDSLTGVQAAQAAGMRVLVYQAPGIKLDLPTGVRCFGSMQDLPALLV